MSIDVIGQQIAGIVWMFIAQNSFDPAPVESSSLQVCILPLDACDFSRHSLIGGFAIYPNVQKALAAFSLIIPGHCW